MERPIEQPIPEKPKRSTEEILREMERELEWRKRAKHTLGSPEYQEALATESGCVEMTLKKVLEVLKPRLSWSYEKIQEITGKERGVPGVVPFHLLKELPKYGVEATYFTAIHPEEFRKRALDHLVEIFGEGSQQEFAYSYNLAKAQAESLGIESHLSHQQLTLEQVRRFLKEGSKIIVFVNVTESILEMLKLGLIRLGADHSQPKEKDILLHAADILEVNDERVKLHDGMGILPEEMTQENFLKIWTIGPKAARETLVLRRADARN